MGLVCRVLFGVNYCSFFADKFIYPRRLRTTTMPDASSTKTRKDVARRVAESMGEPVYKAEPWVRAVIHAIRDIMIDADSEVRIELRDFGVFEVKKTKARPKARNPRTNQTIFVPGRRKTHFRPGKRLRKVLQTPLSESTHRIPDGHIAGDPMQTPDAAEAL